MNPNLQHDQRAKPSAMPDTVCADREAAPTAMHVQIGITGKYNCPKCALKFDRPDVKRIPKVVPWWRMHPEKPCCPHCASFIRSKYSKINIALGWLIVPLILAREWFGFSSPIIYFASMVIVGFCFIWWGVAAWRLHVDAEAYIED